MVVNAIAGAVWSNRDYKKFADESYLMNVIAFRCVDIIAKSVASVPWKLYQKNSDGTRTDVDNHPIVSLLTRPNPEDSFAFLTLRAIAFLVMAGNSYFEKVAPLTGINVGIPKELYVHRPDRMKILQNPSNGRLSGYEYTVNGQSVKWEVNPVTGKSDILQLKLFHPTDDWYGAAITESASREIDTYNEATSWNMSLLQNQARPGMMFLTKAKITDQQYDRLEKQLKETYSGPNNAGKNLIIEGDATAQPYGWSPAEMDYIEGSREWARRIAFAYGVPPELIGIQGDKTYSNYQEARCAFWEETVFFYLNLLKAEFNNWFFTNEDGLELDYVLDKVPALYPRRKELYDLAQNATFLTINEKRGMVGLEEITGGDAILINTTQIPLGTEPDMDESTPPDEEPPPKELEIIEPGLEQKPYVNEHACRLADPGQFDSFARVNNAAKVNGKPIDFIYGIKNGKSTVQAMRYPKDQWSSSAARSHCQKHDPVSFEAASD